MLPGGILVNGSVEKTFLFRPVTGDIEMLFAEVGTGSELLPDIVTAVLGACMAQIGGRQPDKATIENLSIGDRHYLMRMLAVYLGYDNLWLTADCSVCKMLFDVNIQLSELPVKMAGDSYPYIEYRHGDFRVLFRVPTGADQRNISVGSDIKAAEISLLISLVEKVDGGTEAEFINSLTPELILEIEKEIEAVAPEVGHLVATECPECGKENHISADPYICLKLAGKEIYNEIHLLAGTYHWSEEAILRLPRQRRKIYLDLIDRER